MTDASTPACLACSTLPDVRSCGVCGDRAYLVHVPGIMARPEVDHRYACQLCRTLGHGRWSPEAPPALVDEPPDDDLPPDPRDRLSAWEASTPPVVGDPVDV